MEQLKYFLYATIAYPGDKSNEAKLLTKPMHESSQNDCGWGFRSPRQTEPWGVDPKLTYQINPKIGIADSYVEFAGFDLYSEKIINVFKNFGVKYEAFPAKMVDKSGNELTDLKYYIFHKLEGIVDAMDEEKSQWTGNIHDGIPYIVLDYKKFEHRPIFVLGKIYVQLIREDVKAELQNREVKGLGFMPLEQFKSGKYGQRGEYKS